MTRIVAMTSAHIDALMPHELEMFGTEAWTRDGYRAELADRSSRYYVAVEDDDGALLGWAGAVIAGTVADILTVGVLPEARRTGLARAMIEALLTELRRREVSEVLLEVRVDNDAALALYGSEGFRRLGIRRGYYDGGRVDAVTMVKDLPP